MWFDRNIHSTHSRDSGSPIDSILAHAVDIGLDGIAIYDHDTVEGGIAVEIFNLRFITGEANRKAKRMARDWI